MKERLLVCTDLDRTLLPNGDLPESARAREFFRNFVGRPEVSLAYVSGRHLGLVQEAIAEYALPEPDYILSDVGTCLYRREQQAWMPDASWEALIDQDFNGLGREALVEAIKLPPQARLQEAARQNRHKISYYLEPGLQTDALHSQVQTVLDRLQVNASAVFSVDDLRGIGLLDILPASATKRGGIAFLMQAEEFPREQCIFAGDSGNDLDVIASGVSCILVANATADVQTEALRLAREAGTSDKLYIARGGLMGMNGNYSAGILEGILHFHPELKSWL